MEDAATPIYCLTGGARTVWANASARRLGTSRDELPVIDGRPLAEVVDAVIGTGYGNEVAEVARCVRLDLRESPLVPHAQTLTLMRQLDDVRAQVGTAG